MGHADKFHQEFFCNLLVFQIVGHISMIVAHSMLGNPKQFDQWTSLILSESKTLTLQALQNLCGYVFTITIYNYSILLNIGFMDDSLEMESNSQGEITST